VKLNLLDAKRRGSASVAAFTLVVLALGTMTDRASASSGSAVLPDNRAYEQVSPPDKAESDVMTRMGVASVDGNRLLFTSRGSFAGQPTALYEDGTPYLAIRDASGWTTRGIALPGGVLNFGHDGYTAFNPSLTKGVIGWTEETQTPPFDPAAPRGYNIYLHDTETGSFQELNGTLSSLENTDLVRAGTPDFSQLAIDSIYPLTPGSPCHGSGTDCAYEWDHGTLRLASVLPNNQATEGGVGNEGFGCSWQNAMSEDGKRLFFGTPPNVYVREDGTSTHLVSSSERTLPGGATGYDAFFQAAEAAHGGTVLFSTRNALVNTDGDETDDLYLYDFNRPAGERLTLVSEDKNPLPPEGAAVAEAYTEVNYGCAGVVAASEDLRRVYFVAYNQIVAGKPETTGPKLFLWDDTGASPQTTYIGTLATSDLRFNGVTFAQAVDQQTLARDARWSPDGRFLAFRSTAKLTAFDNGGAREIYRYDAADGSLVCVSCVSDAFPAQGEVAFGPTTENARPVNRLGQNVTEDGTVFFQTSRGLVPRDSNGLEDVYEYENGQLYLISKGTGDSDSTFLAASPNGSDVFFATRDRLVGWDQDSNLDAYDARVGGGLPEPAPAPPACTGDACLPPPVTPNDPTPASAAYNGAGNFKPLPTRRCGKHQVRRHGKCRNKRRRAGRHPAAHSHG